MKNAVVIGSILICLVFFGQTPLNDPHWQLAWEDHFEGNVINSSRWIVIDWAKGSDQTLYLKDNVRQSNGNLVITVKKKPIYCPPNPPTIWGARAPCDNKWYNFNSGWIESTQAFNTKYGFIESRVKIPYGVGFFPAFWTWIGDGLSGFSNYAEIDIFEMLGGGETPSDIFNTPTVMTTNIHKDYPLGIPDPNYLQEIQPIGFNYTDWHTYGVEWSPKKIFGISMVRSFGCW